jgi:beta-lactamase superfamily II metal-dependent hydrolase
MNNYQQKKYKIGAAIFVFFLTTQILQAASSLKVTTFDVGQGNGILITCDPHPPVLSDCGSSSYEYRGNNFKSAQIDAIVTALKTSSSATFYLIISHPDKDHYNWAAEVLNLAAANGRTVERAWLGGEAKHYRKKSVLSALQEILGSSYDSRVIFPTSAGATSSPIIVHNGGDVSYSILPALQCTDKAKDSNAASIVLEVNYGGKIILLPGDATARTFKHIGSYLPKQVYIMVASHHGAEPSENSGDACNDKSLIEATKPHVVIFSSGRHDGYLHPRTTTALNYAAVQSSSTSSDWHPLYCGVVREADPSSAHLACISFSNNYDGLLTNKHIYSTLAQGTICCKLVHQIDGSVNLEQIDFDIPEIYKDNRRGALLFSQLENPSAFSSEEIVALRLGGLAIDDQKQDEGTALSELITQASRKCPRLKTLLLADNKLTNPETYRALASLIRQIDIRDLNLEGAQHSLDDTSRDEIESAWNHRGLKLPAT